MPLIIKMYLNILKVVGFAHLTDANMYKASMTSMFFVGFTSRSEKCLLSVDNNVMLFNSPEKQHPCE